MSDVTALKNFRANLRTVCEDRKLSQRALAELAGLAFPNVNRILLGKAEPSIVTCERIAEAVEMPLDLMIQHPADFAIKSEKLHA